MQKVLGMFLNNDINRVEQALEVALLNKGRAEIRHNEISHEQHALVRQLDEHPVRRLSALYRDEGDARSSDRQLCGGTVNEDIGFEAAQVFEVEALAEEVFAQVLWRVEFDRQLLLIIASGVETHV